MQTREQKFGRFAADYDNEAAFDALFNALKAKGYAVENRTWDNDLCPRIGVAYIDIFVEYKDLALRESEAQQPVDYFAFNMANGDDGQDGFATVEDMLDWIAKQPLTKIEVLQKEIDEFFAAHPDFTPMSVDDYISVYRDKLTNDEFNYLVLFIDRWNDAEEEDAIVEQVARRAQNAD